MSQIIESDKYGNVWVYEDLERIADEAKRHYDTMFDVDHDLVEDALITGAAER